MTRMLSAVAAVAAVVGAGVLASPTLANGTLGPPAASPAGTYGGIQYTQYDGVFAGQTSTGTYRVPYRILTPTIPKKGNGAVLVEVPHANGGLGALDYALGRDFLLKRGFAHAGVGYSTADFTESGGPPGNLRILDPSVPGVFINGGYTDPDVGGQTDEEIVVDFGRALTSDPVATSILRLKWRYLTGFSDSSVPVLDIVNSGEAEGVFDLIAPHIAFGADPQILIADRGYSGKVVILNSEWQVEPSVNLRDRGVAPDRYRFYQVAGAPHVSDFLDPPDFWSTTTPASYQPELRAHFIQGHLWVTEGKSPPPSTHLLTDGGGLVRDANGNSIVVDGRGKRVPRLPFVELGEASYFGDDFIGSYDQVKSFSQLGFTAATYLKAFDKKLNEYVKAMGILDEDARAMHCRAALDPSRTFTESYRDDYAAFVDAAACQN
jgi:alpha/beta hydrolase family protein